MKVCTACGLGKPLDAYRVRPNGYTVPTCRPCTNATIQRWEQTSPKGIAGRLLTGARNRAKQGGYAFTLTRDWLVPRLTRGACEVTGIPFDFSPIPDRRVRAHAASLDKVDPDGGYTPENTKVVVTQYNLAKNQWNHETLMTLARALLGGGPQPAPTAQISGTSCI